MTYKDIATAVAFRHRMFTKCREYSLKVKKKKKGEEIRVKLARLDPVESG